MAAEAKKDLLDDSFKYANKKLDPFKKIEKKDVKFQKQVMFEMGNLPYEELVFERNDKEKEAPRPEKSKLASKKFNPANFKSPRMKYVI